MANWLGGIIDSVKSTAVSTAKKFVAQSQASAKKNVLFTKPLSPALMPGTILSGTENDFQPSSITPTTKFNPFTPTQLSAPVKTWDSMPVQDRVSSATTALKAGNWTSGFNMFKNALTPELSKLTQLNEQKQAKQDLETRTANQQEFMKPQLNKPVTSLWNLPTAPVSTFTQLPKAQQEQAIAKTKAEDDRKATFNNIMSAVDKAFTSSLKKARPDLVPQAPLAEQNQMLKNIPGEIGKQIVHGLVGGATMGLSDMAKERFGLDYEDNLPPIYKENENLKMLATTVGGISGFAANMVGGALTFSQIAAPMSAALQKIPKVGKVLAAHPVFTSYVVDNAVINAGNGLARTAMGLEYKPSDFFNGMIQNAAYMAAFSVAGTAWNAFKKVGTKAVFGKINESLIQAETQKGSRLTPEEADSAMLNTEVSKNVFVNDLFNEKRMVGLKGGKKGFAGIDYPASLPEPENPKGTNTPIHEFKPTYRPENVQGEIPVTKYGMTGVEKTTNTSPLNDVGQATSGSPKGFVTEKALPLPEPAYKPEKHSTFMEEGRKDYGKSKTLKELADNAVTEIHDRLAPLQQQKEEGSAAYLKAAISTTETSGRVQLGAEDLKDAYSFPAKLQNTFDDISVHKAFEGRGKQGLNNPGNISSSEAIARVKDVRSKLSSQENAVIDGAIAKVQRWHEKHIVEPLLNSGLATPEDVKKWQDTAPDYLPQKIRKWIEQENLAGQSGFSPDDPGFLKQAEGTVSQSDTDTFRARLKLLQEVNVAVQRKVVVDQVVKEYGIPLPKETNNTAFLSANPEKGVISDDAGNKYSIPFEIHKVVSGLNNEQVGIVGNMFKRLAGIKRTGSTSGRVAFTFTNPFKDPQGAKMYMHGALSYVKDVAPSFAREIMSAVTGKKSNAKIEGLKIGGLSGGIITSERGNIRAADFTPWERTKAVDKVFKVMSDMNFIGKFAKVAGEAGEDATRIAVGKAWDKASYKQKTEILNRLNEKYVTYLHDSDVSPNELKAFIMQRVTMDFNQQGRAMQVWNRYIPFLNVNEKAATRLAAMVKNDPKGFAVASAKYAALPTLMTIGWNAAMGGDDDIDSYCKAKFFCLKTGLMTKNDNGDDVPLLLTIPKGEAGILEVSNAVQSTYDVLSKKDPALLKQTQPLLWALATGEDSGSAALEQVMQSLPQMPLVTQLIEAFTNKDFYRNRAIDSAKYQGVDWKNVSQETLDQIKVPGAYKAIGQYMGLSPFQVQHAINGIWPAAGQYAAATDIATGKANQGSISQFMPLVRPAYKEDKSLDAAYKSKTEAATEKKTGDLNVRSTVENALEMFRNGDPEKGKEIMRTLPPDRLDYGIKYFKAQRELDVKKEKGFTQTDLLVSEMNSNEAIKYYDDNYSKNFDKEKTKELISKLKSPTAIKALTEHVIESRKAIAQPS